MITNNKNEDLKNVEIIKDINEAFEEVFLLEERVVKEGYEEGFSKGSLEENLEAFHLGYHRGAELGAELGCYLSIIRYYLDKCTNQTPDNILKNIYDLIKAIETFPTTNDPTTTDIIDVADKIRTQFKKVCSLLKLKNNSISRIKENDNINRISF